MRVTNLVSVIVHYKLISLGLILILLGNMFDYGVLKINVDDLIVNVGTLFLVVGSFEWLFDRKSRKELIYEVVQSIRGDDRMHRLGLIDVCANSRDVLERDEWVKAKVLIVGIHYSPKFLEDNIDIIEKRIQKRKKTIICHVNPSGLAVDYIMRSDSGLSDPVERIAKIKNLIKHHFNSSNFIETIEHDRVLRYMFIYTEMGVWIKFFTNSKGRTTVPAIKFAPDTDLFRFVKDDIRRMGGIK